MYVGIKSSSKSTAFAIFFFFFFFFILLWFTNEDMLGKKSKNVKGGTYVTVKNIAWHSWVFEFCLLLTILHCAIGQITWAFWACFLVYKNS